LPGISGREQRRSSCRDLASNVELSRKLATQERKYDAQFKVVFDAIEELMALPEPKKKRPIGFGPWDDK